VSERTDPLPGPVGDHRPGSEPVVAAGDVEASDGDVDAARRPPADGGSAPPPADQVVTVDGNEEAPEDAAPARRRTRVRSMVEWGLVLGGALLVAMVVRATLVESFWIPSASMEPTLHEGDRVLVNKMSYRLHDVHRGDLVVFDRPDTEMPDADEESDIDELIKRVVGLPGETIEARDGAVYVDGRRLEEPYLPDGTVTDGLEPTVVPDGHVFVMGDNRGNSRDSRFFGAIDVDSIVGRAFARFYPLGDVGGL
jgi:signal peptidase I